MGYIELANGKIKKLNVWDIGILKVCLIAFALTVSKLWPFILNLAWGWYGGIFLITYVYLIYRFFIKK